MTKEQEMQAFIRHCREQEDNGVPYSMHDIAQQAADMGWPLPVPPTPIEVLAKAFSKAARTEVKKDPQTGLPYKANLAFSPDGTGQATLWIETDSATRPIIKKCLNQRREQMVGDAYQLWLIQDHWNNVHPEEEPIDTPLDFALDVEWLKNGGDAAEEAA